MPHVKQGSIVVDAAHELPVPVDAHAASERSNRLEHEVQSAQEARRERLSAIQPEHPSANPLPMNTGLKSAEHVHHVFKTPKR